MEWKLVPEEPTDAMLSAGYDSAKDGQYFTHGTIYEAMLAAAPQPECMWAEEDEYWETACGNSFVLNDGTPSDNDLKFCPYCGKFLHQTRKGTK